MAGEQLWGATSTVAGYWRQELGGSLHLGLKENPLAPGTIGHTGGSGRAVTILL